MLIDWFTVVAQATNFLVLVWLLKRFLYKPILNAIDAREKRIVAELADANARKAEAIAEREEFRRKNEEFDRQLATQRNRITEEAAAERKRLFDDAQKEVDVLHAKQLEMMDSEFQTLHAEIARRTQDEAISIARHTLAELAGVDVETRMADVFVRRLNEMDGAEKEKLAAGISTSSPVVVRSAFDISPDRRTLIETAIRKNLASASTQVEFETVPGLIGGIELFVQGRKAAWSIADYLASLDKSVGELLKSQRRAGADNKAS